MTPLAWVAACFGVWVGLMVLLAVTWDVWAVKHGHETISRWTLDTSRKHPILPFALGLFVGFVLGCLAGHLFIYQMSGQ